MRWRWRMRRIRACGACAAVQCIVVIAGVLAAAAASVCAMEAEPPPVVVDFFFEPGCVECEIVKREILPELESRFEGFYRLASHDVGVVSNVALLMAYQRELGAAGNPPVTMVVDYRDTFAGVAAIRTGVVEAVERGIAERLAPGWVAPEPIRVSAGDAGGVSTARKNMSGFTLWAVIAGGLADGINPCAISTLVFFMSLLAVAKVRGRGLLAMGLSFCAASFLTYLALGFGLLHVLHAASGFPRVREAVDLVMAAVLACLAFLSFRDAARYAVSGDAGKVTLQLPGGLKRRIHGIMRSRLRTQSLVAGGLVIGVAVTALESVCTGQVYVPTLVVVIRGGEANSRAWAYLLLYNLMFVLPLAAAFVMTYFGLRTETLLTWSRRNVVFSKLLLGFFFVGLLALITLLH